MLGGQVDRVPLDEDLVTEAFAELDPRLVDDAWDTFRAARDAELVARRLPAAAPFGRLSGRLARRWWVSKFNPDLAGEEYWQSDPMDFPWGRLEEAIASDGHWISSEPGHTTRHPFGGGNWRRVADDIHRAQLGDMVLFMRTGRDSGTNLDHHPLMPHAPRIGHQTLIGLTAVYRTILYPHEYGDVCQRVITAPVRLFDLPVAMKRPARERYHPLIANAGAFARANVAYAGLSAAETAAVAAACSIPADLLTEPELAKVTAELQRLRIGPTDDELARLLTGHVNATFNRVIELSGELHVARQAAADGWAVQRVSNMRRIGYDLDFYATDGVDEERRHVEVKSTQGEVTDAEALGRLTTHELRAAEASAAAADNEWWCVIVEHALDSKRRRTREVPAARLLVA